MATWARPPWAPLRPMASACTTCPGTYGNGARTGISPNTLMTFRRATRRGLRTASTPVSRAWPSGCSAAARSCAATTTAFGSRWAAGARASQRAPATTSASAASGRRLPRLGHVNSFGLVPTPGSAAWHFDSRTPWFPRPGHERERQGRDKKEDDHAVITGGSEVRHPRGRRAGTGPRSQLAEAASARAARRGDRDLAGGQEETEDPSRRGPHLCGRVGWRVLGHAVRLALLRA